LLSLIDKSICLKSNVALNELKHYNRDTYINKMISNIRSIPSEDITRTNYKTKQSKQELNHTKQTEIK